MDILFSTGTGVPYFPFQLGGSGDKTEITSNVVNDFFFLFFQFIISDAIIFLLFLLNEKFYHLISEYPFILIQSIHEWTKTSLLPYLYFFFASCLISMSCELLSFDSYNICCELRVEDWNVQGIFCLQEFVVWFSCNKSSCPSFMFCCTKPEIEAHKKDFLWSF